MNKLKKILLCVCLLFVSIISFGCSSVTMNTTLKNNGAIVASIDVELTGSLSTKRKAYQIAKEYYQQLDKAYEENIIKMFSGIYSDVDAFVNDMDATTKISYILTKNPNYIAGDTKQAPAIENLEQSNFMYVEKTFASVYAYLFYFYPDAFEYNATEKKVKVSAEYKSLVDIPLISSYEEENSLFVDKIIQTCNPFYYNGKEPEFLYDKTINVSGLTLNIKIGDKLVNILAEAFGFADRESAEEAVKLYFNFSTPYRRVYSDGTLSRTGLGYTHSWQIENVNSSIKLWRHFANYLPWYVSAAVLVVVGTIIAFIVVYVVKKSKKAKGMKALQKIANLENKKNDK
ncbi:MAG: hypothetical protein IJD48_02605 [Clostridia bacterium]|nr:hypothetical protein [Clostridia bacterium]